MVPLLFPDDSFVFLRQYLDQILLRDALFDHFIDDCVFDPVHSVLFELRDLSLDSFGLSITRGWPLARQLAVELKQERGTAPGRRDHLDVFLG